MMEGTRGAAVAWWGMRGRGDEGAVAVTVAIVMSVLIGFTALVIDVGSLYTERAKVQTAADSAALAGAQDLPDTVHAKSTATTYSGLNAPEATIVKVEFFSGTTKLAAAPGLSGRFMLAAADESVARALMACYTVSLPDPSVADSIRVTVTNSAAPLYFARVWNMNSSQVSAVAEAHIQSLTMSGVLPFAVVAAGSGASFGFTAGQQRNLTEGGGPGNYGWMTLNDPPLADPGNNDKWQKSEFEDVMASNGTGYPVYLTLYPGVTGEKTPYMRAFQSWYDRGNRAALMPVIASSGPGSKNVLVIGFARFHLVARPAKNDVEAVFDGPLLEKDMELGPFWSGSNLNKVALID
jgi:Flp pilus assembly protein TadG